MNILGVRRGLPRQAFIVPSALASIPGAAKSTAAAYERCYPAAKVGVSDSVETDPLYHGDNLKASSERLSRRASMTLLRALIVCDDGSCLPRSKSSEAAAD